MLVKSVEEMNKFAAEMSHKLKGGEVMLLSGPLGSGKTTFTQGLARALGVKVAVTSPSYTVATEYDVPNHDSIKKLVHVDLYRLDESEAASDPAVLDVLEQVGESDRLTVVEWGERLGDKTSFDARQITFDYGNSESERIVKIKN